MLETKSLELLIELESEHLEAYLCPSGIPTIGVGLTTYPNGEKVKLGDVITKEQSREYLKQTLETFEKQVVLLLDGLPLPRKSLDALIIFSFNIGITAFAKSSLLKRIKEDKNNLTVIEKEFNRWIFCKGVKLKGLEKRRQAEYELFEKGILSQYSKSEIFHKCNLK
ncbi:MAG: lysozyme [Bacteroidales bacterium]|nr:lysozyme [Bacteroidales bacterium]